MRPEPASSRAAGLAALAGLACLAVGACDRAAGPEPGSPEYAETVTAFYTGLAAIQVGEDERAERAFARAFELAPGEPAVAANLAIVAYQQRRLEDAAEWASRARARAPDHPNVLIVSALVESAGGRLDDAIAHLRRVADMSAPGSDRPDPRAALLMAGLLEQRGEAGDVAESRRLLDALQRADRGNTYVLVESARHAARHGRPEVLKRDLERLEAHAAAWPEPQRAQLARVRDAADSAGRTRAVGPELAALASSLEPLPAWTRQRDESAVSERQPDILLTRFLRLPAPSSEPPPPDLELAYAANVIEAPGTGWRGARPLLLDSAGPRMALLGQDALVLVGDSDDSRLPVPVSQAAPDAPAAFAALDLDHDFRMDLALAGSGGLRLLRQGDDGRFVELTAAAVPERVRGRAFLGVWAADTDADGDMDLVLAPPDAAPFVLLNRGDGTFAEQDRFAGPAGARQMVWGDLDQDGDADAAFLNAAGRLHAFANPRQDSPGFAPIDLPPGLEPAAAIALGDMDADGTFDLLVLGEDGTLRRAWESPGGWRNEALAEWPGFRPGPFGARLLVADLDNNGALDVAASGGDGTQLWLGDGSYALVPHDRLPAFVTAASDMTGSGRLELLGIGQDGRPVRFSSRPTLDYYALTLSPRATAAPGDRRINTFGIGGAAEVRAGLLYQKQPIDGPVVHMGIGDHAGVSVARILWPNGTSQAEFDLVASQGGRPLVAEQRLKGSCPWLFAYDGSEMGFVTDVLWRTALGLRIGAYGSSAVIHSEDRVKVRGDQLGVRQGAYPLSITAELWESHFFDHVALLVVDHPADTEVFVDERFALPPPPTAVRTTGPLRPVSSARDHRGRDVARAVADRDGRYVDGFELGEFQGVAASEHFVEVDFGPGTRADAPLMLVAHGWVYPTDGSINLAIGQGDHTPPRGIRAEVPDGRGGWKVVHPDLGMPAGKSKTVLVDLAGVFGRDTPRRVRLVTNMEIYWDQLAWAESLPETRLDTARLRPRRAELRFRGFSRTRRGRRTPELPDYDVSGTAPVWRDLEGYHTRFGDVRPLLAGVDDRYVIMNAGDELVLEFEAPPAPPEGWTRDFVLITDGWVKDGDLNNGFSGTLLPLPYHGLTDYSEPPDRLQDDHAFRLHPDDWREYHTRHVTGRPFERALVPDRRP